MQNHIDERLNVRYNKEKKRYYYGYDANSKANIAALPSCYFTITVKDTVSGLSETVKVWLVTSVKSVSLNKSTVNI